jgi:hypothetical protein
MTFTYDVSLSTDLALVRFHIGDTDANAYFLEDATITALLTSETSVGGAVIASIRHILARLSQPNFKADWLQVDLASARKGYQALLDVKQQEFGLSAITTTIRRVYRADSTATEEPDYTNGTQNDDDRFLVIP